MSSPQTLTPAFGKQEQSYLHLNKFCVPDTMVRFSQLKTFYDNVRLYDADTSSQFLKQPWLAFFCLLLLLTQAANFFCTPM